MPVDRAFTIKGTGTVVTGTVWSGRLTRDATVRVLPADRAVRVRGLQTHGDQVEAAAPGHRTAIALAGIDVADVHRGSFLVTDGAWRTSTVLRADVVLLDWCMPGMNGLEVLRRLRRAGNSTPVIFFTVLSEDIYQEAALENGAVDFIDKSRRLSILMKRLRLIVEGARPIPLGDRPQRRDVLRLGDLELRFDTHRAIWAGTPIDLTLTEFKIVALLVQRTGEDVSYREIYDVVHGKGFAAGYGGEGYRPNVRTFITRIRVKFHDVDPGFQHIYNCAGFGYRWCAE